MSVKKIIPQILEYVKPVGYSSLTENRTCSIKKGISNCFLCEIDCKKGLLAKLKPYGFTIFAKRYGLETLLDCLERNEKNGVVYHREGIYGDYDGFTDLEELIAFIKNAPDLLVR